MTQTTSRPTAAARAAGFDEATDDWTRCGELTDLVFDAEER